MKTVNYDKNVGKYIMPEGFKEILIGKSIEEQLIHFVITFEGDYIYYQKDFNERKDNGKCLSINEVNEVDSLVIDDGVIVGVNVNTQYGLLTCFIEQGIIVSDDLKRVFLVCVSNDF